MSFPDFDHDSVCPYCGKVMDGTMGVETDTGPTPGDSSICFYCAGLCIYNESLQLRFPTDEELTKLSNNPTIKKVRAAVLLTMSRMQR